MLEPFKISNKSLCHGCNNIEEICSMKVMMVCGTDSKVGKAFVQKCGGLNKDLNKKIESKRNTVSVAHAAESRVDMMGGGHNLEINE